MKCFYPRTTLLLVLLNISYVLFARPINWKSTERVYVKTFQELSLQEAQKNTKLKKNTYILPSSELSDIKNLQYFSPIWESEQELEQYAIDNSIILYDVYSLSALIRDNNLNTNVISIDSIRGEPLIYILSLRNMSYEKIDSICAILMAGSYCKIAEPNYVIFNALQDDISPAPENNPHYTDQWGLHNSIYPQYDINAREAWRISTGIDIKVAVIDVGFELAHPDLINNIYSSYDCTDGADGSVNGAYMLNIDSHGTQCAGVVAATNNDIGVVGVAPDSRLILLRRGYTIISGGDTIFYAESAWHINALRTAYQLGADVINNSWSMNTSSNNLTIFDEVLYEAYSLGRSGKGAVVVFSTGNQSKTFINYPSNSPYTISVGAMNEMGFRCYFSNYGQKLDVVAPGYNIWTTQIIPKGSYVYSSGTSFAAPMVAGVAALMLSTNPNLTCSEVGSIIKKTAYKMSHYSFDSTTIYGSWNDEVGYGLVDAYAAVVSAAGGFIQGPDYVCDTAKYYLIRPSQTGETVAWSVNNGTLPYPHYSIIGPANQDTVRVACEYVNVRGTNQVSDLPNFTKSLSVTISNSNNNTSDTYSKNFRMPFGQTPTISASSSAIWYSGTSRMFTVTNCTNVPDTAITWCVTITSQNIFGQNITLTTNYTGRSIIYTPALPFNATTGTVTVTATNTLKECGDESASNTYFVRKPKSLLSNLDGDILNVTISEGGSTEQASSQSVLNSNSGYSLELWNSIYGCMLTQAVNSFHEQMDVSSLPRGVYVLLLKENSEIIAQDKVIIQN